MKKIDRVILAVIALSLTAIALNPWVAPGYVSAQGIPANVNIAALGGHTIRLPLQRLTDDVAGFPVIVLNVNDLRK
ncbi:MAG: hypothetical protein AABZ64_10590 [Nitrospinota bacterium]